MEEGGTELTETEKKNDLTSILPQHLQDSLIWSATDEGITYNSFRDRIKTQAAKMQLIRRKQVNLIGTSDDTTPEKGSEEDDESMVAALGKSWKEKLYQTRRTWYEPECTKTNCWTDSMHKLWR